MQCIFISRSTFPKVIYDELSKHFQIDVWNNDGIGMWSRKAAPPPDVLRRKFSECDGAVITIGDRITEDILRDAKIRILATYSVGFDHIDLHAATRLRIPVAYTPEVLVESVADFAIGLMLSAARRIVDGDKIIRSGNAETVWGEYMGDEVWGKTLGILGLGNIGIAVARRAAAFKMRIIYWSKHRKPNVEIAMGVSPVTLDEIFRQSDYLIISVALTPETRHLVNEDRLRLMKRNAYVINIARGAVIDTPALIKALREGWIRGAALDVYEDEPLPTNSELLSLNNVVLTPHIASASFDTRNNMAEIIIQSVINVLIHGKPPIYIANPEAMGDGR